MSPHASPFVDQWNPWDVKCQHLWRNCTKFGVCICVLFWGRVLGVFEKCMHLRLVRLKVVVECKLCFCKISTVRSNTVRCLNVFVQYMCLCTQSCQHGCTWMCGTIQDLWWLQRMLERKDYEIVVPLKKYPTSVRAHNLFTSACKVSLAD